jgi:hypothetical protein
LLGVDGRIEIGSPFRDRDRDMFELDSVQRSFNFDVDFKSEGFFSWIWEEIDFGVEVCFENRSPEDI